MKQIRTVLSLAILISLGLSSFVAAQTSATNVAAFWSFEGYDFEDPALPDGPNKQDILAEQGDLMGTANLQAYLGVAANLDTNGGGGAISYTSPVSGTTYGPSRTIKFDDLKGGGNDFDIGGVALFDVDKNDGAGVVAGEDFGNDALIYLTLDGTGYKDLEIRFDIEGTPGINPADPANTDLPLSFDLFYRTTGSGGTWFRETAQNNIPLTFANHVPIDPDNMFADSGYQAMNSALDNQSQIEIIVGDFAEFGNNEMELDNIEIVANVIASGLPCDLDADGDCDHDDIDMLYATSPSAADISDWLADAEDTANPWKTDTARNPGGAATDSYVIGDVNLDGDVDSVDLGLLLNNFNGTTFVGWGGGDLTADNAVDSVDLGQLLNNFNFTSASVNAVPEPNAVILLGLGMLSLLGRAYRGTGRFGDIRAN